MIDGKPATVLIICQKKIEEELIKLGLPETIKTAHFNAIKGLNTYSDIPKLVIAGRPLPPRQVVEKYACVMKGGQITPTGMGEGLYPFADKPIYTTDGQTINIKTPYHPDSLAEEIRWQICEAELIQAIGRGRGIRREAVNSLEIDIITNVPLPFLVDTITTWEEIIPDKLDLCLAMEEILPLAQGEMHRLYSQYFGNVRQSKYLLGINGGKKNIIKRFCWYKIPYSDYVKRIIPSIFLSWVVEYKRLGKGCGAHWLTALIQSRHRNPREILEQKTGTLADFKLLPQEMEVDERLFTINGKTKTFKGSLVVGYTETGRVYARVPMGKPRAMAMIT